MKQKLVISLGIVLALGFFLYYKNSEVTPLKSKPTDSKVESLEQASAAAQDENKQLPMPQPTAQTESSKPEYKPNFNYSSDKAFGIANPPLDPNVIRPQFEKNSVLDGILIEANFSVIKGFFEKGLPFEIPILNNDSVKVIPRRIYVNQDQTTMFIGETDTGKEILETPPEEIEHEVQLFFMEDLLLSGKVTTQNGVFLIKRGREGSFLLKVGTVKVD